MPSMVAAFVLLVTTTMSLAACGGDKGGPAAEAGSVQVSGVTPRKAARSIEGCLGALVYRVQFLAPQAGDKDAPDYAVTYWRGEKRSEGGEIALYGSKAEADRKFAGIEANAESFDGLVEAHGLATVVYFREPPADIHDDVLRCLGRVDAA